MPDEKLVSAGLRVFFDAQINRIAVWGGVTLLGWGFYSRIMFGNNDITAIGTGFGLFIYGSLLAIWRERAQAEEREQRSDGHERADIPMSNTEAAFLTQFTAPEGYTIQDLQEADFGYAKADTKEVNLHRLSISVIKNLTYRGHFKYEGGKYIPLDTSDRTVLNAE